MCKLCNCAQWLRSWRTHQTIILKCIVDCIFPISVYCFPVQFLGNSKATCTLFKMAFPLIIHLQLASITSNHVHRVELKPLLPCTRPLHKSFFWSARPSAYEHSVLAYLARRNSKSVNVRADNSAIFSLNVYHWNQKETFRCEIPIQYLYRISCFEMYTNLHGCGFMRLSRSTKFSPKPARKLLLLSDTERSEFLDCWNMSGICCGISCCCCCGCWGCCWNSCGIWDCSAPIGSPASDCPTWSTLNGSPPFIELLAANQITVKTE